MKWWLRRFFLSAFLAFLLWIVLLVIGGGIFGYLIWQDIRSLQNEILNQPKYLLYETDGHIPYGIALTGLSLTPNTATTPFHDLTPAELTSLAQQRQGNLQKTIIITIKQELFTPLPEEVTFPLGEQPLSVKKTQLLAILAGGSPQTLMKELLKNSPETAIPALPTDIPPPAISNLPTTIPTDQLPSIPAINDTSIRSLILIGLLKKTAENGAGPLFQAYQQGIIQYTPDHLTLRLLRMIDITQIPLQDLIPQEY